MPTSPIFLDDIPMVTVKTLGAAGNGTTDDRAALNGTTAANTYYFPPGDYKISSNLTLTQRYKFAKGARLLPDTGVIVSFSGTIEAGAYQIFGGLGTVAYTGKGGALLAKWWGATGDGTTDDRAALNKLVIGLGSTEQTVEFTPGVYKISSALTLPSTMHLQVDKGAYLSPDFGVTLTISGTVEIASYTYTSGTGTVSIAAGALSFAAGLTAAGSITANGELQGTTGKLTASRLYPGNKGRFFGDSFVVGSQSTAGNDWVSRLCTALGWAKTNSGVGGTMLIDSNGTDLPYQTTVADDDSFFVAFGQNDYRLLGSDADKLLAWKDNLRAVTLWLANRSAYKYKAQNAAVTKVGTWVNSSRYSASMGINSSDVATPASASANVFGSTVYVGITRQSTASATFTISIDGVLQTAPNGATVFDSLTPNNVNYQNGAADRNYAPHVFRFPFLTNTKHTVVVTLIAASGGSFLLDWIGGNGDATTLTGPFVYLPTPCRFPASRYSLSAPYDQGSDAVCGLYGDAVKAVADELNRVDGLYVYVPDFGNAYNPDDGMCGVDTIHPNDAGYLVLYAEAARQVNTITRKNPLARPLGISDGVAPAVAITAGYVQFGGSSGLTQDSQFKWDSALHQLRVGDMTSITLGLGKVETVTATAGKWSEVHDTIVGVNTAIKFRTVRGSFASPTHCITGDLLGGVVGSGKGGFSSSNNNAAIFFKAAEAHADTGQGTYVDLCVTKNATITQLKIVRIHDDGGVIVGKADLGAYGTSPGAGTLQACHFAAAGTTALTGAAVALDSGGKWGNAATVAALGNDTRGTVSVSSSGSGKAADPWVEVTWNQPFMTTPFCFVNQDPSATGWPASSGQWVYDVNNSTASVGRFKWIGTPTTDGTYKFNWFAIQ